MTRPTEHPRRALPAAGASDRGASSPSPGRAYRNHAEEIAAAMRREDGWPEPERNTNDIWPSGYNDAMNELLRQRERDGTKTYDCRYRVTPEQSARLAQMWEAPEPPRRWPSGWWVIPAAVLGLAGWVVALWVVL